MAKATLNVANSTKSEELNDKKGVKIGNEVGKSIDNAIGTAEDNKETDNVETVEEKAEESHGNTDNINQVVIRYVGNGIWLDGHGEYWGRNNNNNTTIRNERIYSAAEYESRDDLRFMVKYNEMIVTNV